MQLAQNRGANGAYRYLFNGMEKDDEISGAGDHYDFGARMFRSDLGRWLSIDPLTIKYPQHTPYVFVGNSPLYYIDTDGKKLKIYYKDEKGKTKKIKIKTVEDLEKLTETNSEFVEDIALSINYLMGNNADAGIIEEVINSKKTIKIRSSSERQDYHPVPSEPGVGSTFDWTSNTIYWDSEHAVAAQVGTYEVSDFTTATPAFTLLSEFGKAYFINVLDYEIKVERNGLQIMGLITLLEPVSIGEQYESLVALEELVIDAVENPASLILGEGYRQQWQGTPVQVYETTGPTSTEPADEEARERRDTFRDKYNYQEDE